MPFDIPLCTIIEDEEISDEELEKLLDELEDLTDEKQDIEIISLLSRSKKRLEVLESLENENKIPSVISKDINDSSHHISKYLKTLKEYGLVVCLNENDKRYRYYSITPKGTKYLNIVKIKNKKAIELTIAKLNESKRFLEHSLHLLLFQNQLCLHQLHNFSQIRRF